MSALNENLSTNAMAAPKTPQQSTFTCRLSDCAAMAAFKTHQMSGGLYLSVELTLPPVKQTRSSLGKREVQLAFVVEKIESCRADYDDYSAGFWLGGASIKIDRRDMDKAAEFFSTLAVDIRDRRTAK